MDNGYGFSGLDWFVRHHVRVFYHYGRRIYEACVV